MNGRWVKSNKIVNFPMETFDPSEFVVKRTTTSNASEDGTFVRTVNVQTAVEERLEHGKEPVALETDSNKVRNCLIIYFQFCFDIEQFAL